MKKSVFRSDADCPSSGHKGAINLRRLYTLFVLVITLAGFVRLAVAQDCILQTWKGTIGDVPVMMQFEAIEADDASAGRYYSRTSFVDLILIRDDEQPERWKELDAKGKVRGYLTLACQENILSGTWSSMDGSKTLPINAKSQSAESYSKQRLAQLKTTGERASFGKFRYEFFTAQGFDKVSGLRLIEKNKAVTGINRALMERFKIRLEAGSDCLAAGRIQRGEDHDYDYDFDMNIIAWNKSFVVIGESVSEYCGGMHPAQWSGATTYNLRTGKPEEVPGWLIGEYRKGIPKDSALGKILLGRYRQKDVQIYPTQGQIDPKECPNAIEFSSESMWPTAMGLTFRPSAPYVHSACIVDITIPYKRLLPYLSSQGKANIKAFGKR